MRYFYVVGFIKTQTLSGNSVSCFSSETYPTCKKCKELLLNGDKRFSTEDVLVISVTEMSADDYKSFTSEL